MSPPIVADSAQAIKVEKTDVSVNSHRSLQNWKCLSLPTVLSSPEPSDNQSNDSIILDGSSSMAGAYVKRELLDVSETSSTIPPPFYRPFDYSNSSTVDIKPTFFPNYVSSMFDRSSFGVTTSPYFWNPTAMSRQGRDLLNFRSRSLALPAAPVLELDDLYNVKLQLQNCLASMNDCSPSSLKY